MSRINVINGANSTLLDFDFVTRNQARGSFTLNTSVEDSDPNMGTGLFEGAVKNVKYPTFGINDSGPLNVSTRPNGPVVIFDVEGLNNNDGSYLDVYLDYENPDLLSNDPNDYFISQTGNFAGYGGLIGTSNSGQFSRIVGLNVTKLINGTKKADFLLGTKEDDKLKGFEGKDLLLGKDGDDILDGGAGSDLLLGGRGADKFVLAKGQGRDRIFDYKDGTDSFLLANGLEFEELTITQGTGQTSIKLTETNEVLTTIVGVRSDVIEETDFTKTVV